MTGREPRRLTRGRWRTGIKPGAASHGRESHIRLAHPWIPRKAVKLVREVLESGWLTSGAAVAKLEGELGKRLGGREVVVVSSGTTAALIVFHLLRDDGVKRLVMPDFCFPSVASSALRVGLELLLVDIDSKRWSLDLNAAAEIKGGREVAILSVDQFGIPGNNDAIAKFVSKRGWAWVEDAACALGSFEGEHTCGTLSDLAILSFHPRKVLTTGEGGAILTGSKEWANKARLLRNLGMTGEGIARHFEYQGYNARMSELHAAVGLAQMQMLDFLLKKRRAVGLAYIEELDRLGREDLPALSALVPDGTRLPGMNFQSMVVLLPEGTDRGKVMEELLARGVETSVAGFAIHLQPAFKGVGGKGPFPLSLALHERGLALPVHERMSPDDARFVVRSLVATLRSKALLRGRRRNITRHSDAPLRGREN